MNYQITLFLYTKQDLKFLQTIVPVSQFSWSKPHVDAARSIISANSAYGFGMWQHGEPTE